MHLRKTEAVVVQCTDFGEADLIVTLYTSELGKIRCIAKGARKSKRRFMNTLQPLSYIRVVFAEGRGGLVRIDQADIIQPFFRISEDIFKVLCGFYWMELISEMTVEREANVGLFCHLIRSLEMLDEMTPRDEELRFFELRLLDLLGYRPRLSECTVCSQNIAMERTHWFSFRHGGVVCLKCRDRTPGAIPVSEETVRAMETVIDMESDAVRGIEFSLTARSESKKILPRFIQYQLGKGLKSLRVMEEIERAWGETV